MFRRPLLGLAEISWRWSVGLATVLLGTFSFLEYLDTLPVNAAELLLLRSRQPALISQALARIFKGTAPRFVLATMVVGAGLALAWIVIAAFGRAATVRALLSYFREFTDDSQPVSLPFPVPQDSNWRLAPLLGLNFFRVSMTLAAAVGCLGAMLLAGSTSSKSDPAPGSATLIFLMLLMLVWLTWTVVNWFLSLAAVFVVADGCDTFAAIAAAVRLCRNRAGSVFAAGTWFGLAHLVAFFIATSVVAFPLALARVLPGGVVFGGVLLVTLLYFAVVDFLYTGRLAAYVAIVELPPPMPVVSPPPPPLPPQDSSQLALDLRTCVDRDELILSDLAGDVLPNPAGS
ncbi:MAG: hypothetical protein LAO03_16550 [Acidobacteriia bacterium]|nr:hypothetical protein [Terriglobia bacterium]